MEKVEYIFKYLSLFDRILMIMEDTREIRCSRDLNPGLPIGGWVFQTHNYDSESIWGTKNASYTQKIERTYTQFSAYNV